jgi:hypothetical protein
MDSLENAVSTSSSTVVCIHYCRNVFTEMLPSTMSEWGEQADSKAISQAFYFFKIKKAG